MNFSDELLNVVDSNFVQKVINKVNISKVLDKLDTQEIALSFKEEVEDNLDPSELRDNIVECVLENVKDEMGSLVMDKLYDKYVVDITEKFSDTLKISDLIASHQNKTLEQVRYDIYELVEDKIFNKALGQVEYRVACRMNRGKNSKKFSEKVDEVLEIAGRV